MLERLHAMTPNRQLLSDRWLPWMVLATTLALTYWLWNNHRQSEQQSRQALFQFEVSHIRAELDARIDGHKQVLRAAAALFSSTDRVSHDAWRDYVAGLNLEQVYPVIQALSFARTVNTSQVQALVSQMRGAGVADFAVRPAGERDQYVVTTFTGPMRGANRKAIGQDLWHDADQRKTMQHALATGAPAITGKLSLETDAQGQPVPGFIMYQPVIRKTGEVHGYVLSPFRMPVLIEEMLKTRPPAIFLSVHDVSDGSAENLLYAGVAQERLAAAKFVHLESISVGGRTWSMQYASRPEFETLVGLGDADTIGAVGVLVSLFLFGIAWLLVNRREYALRLARDLASERTHDLDQERLRLQMLMQTASDGIHILDAEGLLIEANPAFLDMLGRDESAIGRLRVTDWEAQLDRTATQEVIGKLLNAQTSTLFESQHKRSDGSLIEVEIHARGIVIEGQHLVYCAARDITARKRKDEESRMRQIELEGTRDQMAAILDAIPDLLFELDLEGRYHKIYSNRAKLLFVPPEQMLGRTVSEILPPAVAEVRLAALREAYEQGYSNGRQYELPLAQGNRWFELSVSRKPVEPGQPPRFIVLSRDITERKQAEESQARLSTIVESSNDAIISRTLDGTVLTWNAGAQKMFGYTAAEIIGKSVDITVPSEYHSRMPKINEALLRGEVIKNESRRITKDGGVFDVFGSHSPIKDASGNVVAVSVIFQDITERKQNEQELERAKVAAEAANLAKSHFLATMSHELRTPMNAILGMAQVLRMPDISEAERLEYAGTIFGSGQTLLTLLNDILDLSKVEAGKVTLESIAMEPAQVVAETHGLFAESARARGLRIEFDCSGVREGYVGDPYRLRQMLSNLVGNAIKFTAQGSVRIEARELARDTQAAVLEFSVIDTGIGVSKEDQSRLFQPFTQADSSITRSYGGSGLGLSLVAGMARLMGGEAGIESEVGRGSRFWFRIRAGLSAVAEPLAHQSFAGAGALARVGTAPLSGSVLVVEDNLVNQKVSEILLHKLGLSTALAEDGQQALDAIMQGEAADLILMDVYMPRMDGYAATQAIRAWEKRAGQPRRPIIALTADAFHETRQRCQAAGMDEVLTKPIAFDILQEMLARWLPEQATEVMAAPAAQQKPVDNARVAALVNEILPLLAQHQFDAIGRYRVLREAVAGTHLEAEIGETGRLLERFLFEPALERLRRMAARYSWDASKHG